MIKRRDYKRRSPDNEIEKQRERIDEREDYDDSVYEPTSSPVRAGSQSEAAIKSMFRNTDWSASDDENPGTES